MSDGKHDAEAKYLIEALAKKGVNGPCPRCGNNAFSIVTLASPMYMVFCKNCGLKFEHWSPILLDPDTVNTSETDESEEGNET